MSDQVIYTKWETLRPRLDERLARLDTIADQLAKCIPKVGSPIQILGLIAYLSLERQRVYSAVPAKPSKARQCADPSPRSAQIHLALRTEVFSYSMPAYRTNLAILNASPELLHIDAGSPHCLMKAISMGCNRHWDIIRQDGQPMTAPRLLELMAYALRRGLQANWAEPSTVFEPMPDIAFEWMGKVKLPTPIMISNMLLSLALDTRRGKSILRRYLAITEDDTAIPKIMMISIPKEAKISIALSYLQSEDFGQGDGGPVHLWAASVVLGKPIIALELATNAPCILGEATAAAPYYTYYYPWKIEGAIVSPTRRAINDPVALELMRARKALAVVHLPGHWHHMRHTLDEVLNTFRAFNPLGDKSPWEERLSLQTKIAGDSKEGALELMSSEEEFDPVFTSEDDLILSSSGEE